MNAPFENAPTSSPSVFAPMVGQANKWRGQCIQYFAELEQAVESLLRDLVDRTPNGETVTVGLPVGQAFKQLRDLTGHKGPFASDLKSINAILSDLARWFEWRAHLTHGVLKVWRDDDGAWLIALSHRSSGDGTIRTFALSWEDARLMHRELAGNLSALRANVRTVLRVQRKTNSRSLDPGDTPSA